MKRTLLLASALLAAAAIQAAPVPPGPVPGPGARVPADSPAAVAERGLDRLMAFLEQSDGDLQKLGAFLNREIAPYFDFAYMARAAAGNLWQRMDEQQRRRLAARIKRQFLAALVERLGDYDRQSVRVVSQRLSPDGRTGVVTAAIRNPGGYPARMDFRFYRSKDGWKVYDVSANGQSAVVHYRRQFRQALMGVPGRGAPAYPPRYR